jgi:ribosome assembly protein YihI (activator of Der GTPase)
MAHEQQIEDVKRSVGRLIEAINADGELSDEEAQICVDLEQWVADRFSELFEKHGVEIGDERVD